MFYWICLATTAKIILIIIITNSNYNIYTIPIKSYVMIDATIMKNVLNIIQLKNLSNIITLVEYSLNS